MIELLNNASDFVAGHLGKTCAIVLASVSSFAVPVFVAANSNMSVLTPEGWAQLAVQGAMTFVFAIFLLWVWPQQNKFQRDMAKDMQEAITKNNDANAAVVKTLTGSFERHDVAWREFISKHGYCPVRDGKQSEPGTAHEA